MLLQLLTPAGFGMAPLMPPTMLRFETLAGGCRKLWAMAERLLLKVDL